MMPSMIAWAAAAANVVPCSSARNKTTGPEVSGRPTSQPLTAGPQRRPARLTAPISSGLTSSLKRKVAISACRLDTPNLTPVPRRLIRAAALVFHIPHSAFRIPEVKDLGVAAVGDEHVAGGMGDH